MPQAVALLETIGGVAGVRFTTDARQHTDEEDKLQEIQLVLSEGKDILPVATTLPHLALVGVAVADAPSFAVISLWVPAEQRLKASKMLEAKGFSVS